MKKTKLTRSLLAACSIVALSAVMYGCSHSGDDPVEPVVEQPDPDAEAMALATAQSAAMGAWLAARDAVASIADTNVAPVAQQLAMNAQTDARAAYDAAMAATTSAEAQEHQAAAEAARDMATQQVAMVVAPQAPMPLSVFTTRHPLSDDGRQIAIVMPWSKSVSLRPPEADDAPPRPCGGAPESAPHWPRRNLPARREHRQVSLPGRNRTKAKKSARDHEDSSESVISASAVTSSTRLTMTSIGSPRSDKYAIAARSSASERARPAEGRIMRPG